MAIYKVSDQTTKKNRSRVLGGISGFNMTGGFRINVYPSVAYNTNNSNSSTEGCGLWNKYCFNWVNSINAGNAEGYLVVTMIPNDNSTKLSYSQLQFGATTSVYSCYYLSDRLYFNYDNGGLNPRCLILDLINGTWTGDSAYHTTGDQITNTSKTFQGYTFLSAMTISGGSASGFSVHPYIRFL